MLIQSSMTPVEVKQDKPLSSANRGRKRQDLQPPAQPRKDRLKLCVENGRGSISTQPLQGTNIGSARGSIWDNPSYSNGAGQIRING